MWATQPPAGAQSALRGRALFDYVAQSPNQISFRRGQVIGVISFGAKGDWSNGVILESGKSGYFPSDYVEQIAAQQQMPNMMSQATQQNHMQMGLNPGMQNTMMGAAPFQQNAPMMGVGPVQQMHGASATSNLSNVLRARVLFNFSADGPNQMKLTAGEIIEVLSRGAPGGWCRGTSGAFPTDYVEILSGTGMQTNAPSLTAPNILLNSASLGSTMNTNTDLRQLPVNSFAGGQPSIFNQSKSTDESGKMRIDLMSSGAGRYGGQSIGTATTSAPTTPVGSLLDMDLDAGVIHKSNSMSQSKVEELDIFGIDNCAVPSMTSLLDLDAPIDLPPALRPDSKNKSLLDIPMPVMNAIKGNHMNADLALEGFMSSSRPPIGSLLPERSPSTDTFQKTTSSAMMYNSSNLNMSSFDRLDIFSDSTSSTVMASSSSSAIMNGFQSQDVMDLRSLSLASSVSGSVTSSHNDGVRKSDAKPPPVTARVVPPTLYARAIYSREGDGPTELSLECGDFILVDTKEGEWWSGSKVASIGAGENTKGKIGYFPGNYVELVEGDVVTAALHSTPPSSVHGFSDDSNPFGSLMKMTSSARKVALRGTNAAQAIFLPDTDDLSGMAKSAPIVKLSSTFVCSLSIGENIPIWRHPAFADFYVDFHVPHPTPPPVVESKNIVITNNAVKKMSVALRLVCMSLQRAREVFINAKNRISSAEEVKNEFLSQVLLHNISVFNEGSKLCDKLPAGTGDPEKFFMFLTIFMIKFRSLRENESMIAPCAWVSGADGGEHGVFLVVTKTQEGTDNDYAVAVINTSNGDSSLDFHAASVDPADGTILRNVAFQLTNIPNSRIDNTAFWMLVFKSAVEPNPKFAGKFLYEKVLPYLTSMPVLSALQVSIKLGSAVNDSRPVPLGGDKSFINCAVECLRYIGRAAGLGCAQANHLPMVVSAGMLLMVENDLELVKILSPPEADLVTMACRALARVAAAQVGLQGSMDQEDATTMSISQLNAVSESISAVGRKLQLMDERMTAPSAFKLVTDEQLPQVCEWPLFGRLRRDFDVEALAGDAPVAPIIRPIEMTLVPDNVFDFQGVAAAMRHALNLCVLLANQRSVVRNSYTLRVCMLEHLFVRVIPLPLPITHKKRDSECFWHAQPMRYETQADILRLLSLLSQHFATASLSVKSTRSGDAVRMLTFASMATVCDAALRKIACDIPSQSSLHYSGRAKGPIHPFGFELGTFEEESEYLKLSFPESAVARTQVLDYFHQMKKVIKPSHMLFAFDNMECSSTDVKFIDQLCLQVGFDRELELEYLTGEDDVFLAHYPEVGFVRDIVFMLKLVMVPTSDRLPELKHWTPKDAGLKWGNRDGKYTVLAFGRSLDCSQEQESVEEQQVSQKAPRGAMARLFRYLGFSGKKPRSTPSQANPSILLGERVDTEDDILHIRNLPDFDGTLGAKDCELMLQYLTAPYMRIPLLLSFFSNEVRLKALRNTNMQEVLDAALFEPGQWKCEFDIPLPSVIPGPERDHLCTPVGLLFNEIVMSPNAIMASVLHMLERVVDMDSGKYSELGESILYVTRLAIRVEGYLLFLIRNKRFHTLQKESEVNLFNGAYVKADVRGLRCGEDIINEALECQKKIRVLLEEKMFKIIARWIKRSKKDGRFGQACMLHAHLAFIYRNVEPEELTPRVVFTMLASQIFLFNYYKYDLDLEHKEEAVQVKRTDIEDIRGDLGVPQVELFAMFQRCRRMVFNWLGDHNSERNQVMDAIVQMVEEGQRKHMLKNKKSERSQFNWIAIEQAGMNFAGRFVPDIEHDEEGFLLNLSAATKYSFEEWLRETTTLSVNTEINVQLGEFTVRKNITKPCDDSMTNDKDFISAFSSLRINDVIQCADVKNTTNRKWVRLVGLGYDLQLWAPDTRRPSPPIKSSYDDCTTQWIKDIFDPWKELVLPGIDLYIKSDTILNVLNSAEDAEVAIIYGI